MGFRQIARFAMTGFLLVLALSLGQVASAQTTLRVVKHSDLKIVDPIWTTAYMSRNYGYMVYDTLFAMDEKLDIKPQMVDTYSVSNDKLTYTFTLRDGLLWHDGAPVKAEDCVASIKRWGQRDSMGQKLMQFTRDFKVISEKAFQLILKEPYGLVLQSLGKPSSNVPFIMPKRIAETPADKQISEYVGSGPFIFKADEWRPGDKAVFVKNPKYKPRSEPPSWASGGKVVKLDRVEWVWIPDHQTAINALIAGEIDYIETPPHDLLPLLEAEKDKIGLEILNPLGGQYMLRMNHLHPPFNNIKLRQAALASLQQEDFLKAVVGNPKYYKTCQAMFICGTPLATNAAAPLTIKADLERARRLLKEGGYDGTPVVIMQSTDVAVLNNLAPVAANALKQAGFKVDLQAMDWQTLVSRRAKKEHPSQGGWSVFLTNWVAADVLNPIMAAAYATTCDKAWFGWPCDEKMEKLRDAFARETDPQKQKQIAEQIQVYALEFGTHATCGQWYIPTAWRKDRFTGLLQGPVPFFWNIAKK